MKQDRTGGGKKGARACPAIRDKKYLGPALRSLRPGGHRRNKKIEANTQQPTEVEERYGVIIPGGDK